MYAAIANGGTIWKPTIAKAIVKTDGTVVKTFASEKLGELGVDATTIAFLHDALHEVTVAGTSAGCICWISYCNCRQDRYSTSIWSKFQWHCKIRYSLVCIFCTSDKFTLRRCDDG
jgi:hypothetical protein